MQIKEQELKQKGWNDEEINHAKRVLLKAKTNHKPLPWMKFLEKLGIWLFFVFIIGGAILGAWLIEPFLLILNKTSALISIFIIGLLYGSLASILARDIESIETHHHILISLCIPLSAIVTSIIISKQAANISQIIGLGVEHNPILLGITFTVSSFIPYGIFLLNQRRQSHGAL